MEKQIEQNKLTDFQPFRLFRDGIGGDNPYRGIGYGWWFRSIAPYKNGVDYIYKFTILSSGIINSANASQTVVVRPSVTYGEII